MVFSTEAATVAAERGRPGVPKSPETVPSLLRAGAAGLAAVRLGAAHLCTRRVAGASVFPGTAVAQTPGTAPTVALSGITTHVPVMAKTRPKKEKKKGKNRTAGSCFVLELVCPLMSIVPILTDRKKLTFSSLKLQETRAGG